MSKQYSSGSKQVSIVSVKTPLGRLEIQALYGVAVIFRKWNSLSGYRSKQTAAMAHLSREVVRKQLDWAGSFSENNQNGQGSLKMGVVSKILYALCAQPYNKKTL